MRMTSIAIVVGVDRYQDHAIPHLRYASQDATRVARTLKAMGLPPDHLILLTNEEASRAEILKAIRVTPLRMFGRVDRIIFYFAGHGANPATRVKTASSVLLPFDALREDLEASGITFADLLSALN